MSDPKPVRRPVQFTYTQSVPGIVSVSQPGDEAYEIRVAVTIMEVVATGKTDPRGLPEFEVQAHLALETRKAP